MKIGLAQFNPKVGDIEGNARRIIENIVGARGRGVDLLIFPEQAITGYPVQDLIFVSGFVERNLEALDMIKDHAGGITIIVGFTEKHELDNDKFSNSAAIISNGEIIKVIKKQLLPNYDVFDEKRYFIEGPPTKPVKIGGMQLGVSICEDLWDDEYDVKVVDDLIQKGADMIITINASPYYREKWKVREDLVRRKVKKYKKPIVYLNMVGGQDEITFDGASFVMDGRGEIVFRAPAFEEGLFTIEVGPDCSMMPQELAPHLPVDEEVFNALCLNLKDYFNKIGVFKGVLLGLSGGVDSAFTAVVSAQAVGADKLTCIYMPTKFNSDDSYEYSKKLCENLGCKFIVFPIEKIFRTFLAEFDSAIDGNTFNVADENLQARIRANILMYYSNKFNLLLVSTGNKSEISTGYCTLYGDTSGGKNIPGDLFKMELFRICENFINKNEEIIPRFIITRPPTAELKNNQKDEDSLPPYSILDQILEPMIEGFKSPADIIKMGFDEETVMKVQRLVNIAEFKRAQLVQTIKISPKSFGTGRRVPITNGYNYK
ncbi:MAG: NAD+ synthase [Promethearchaeota archaeon]